MFFNGSFSSFATLQASVETVLQAQGWALVSGILSKDGMFIRISNTATEIRIECGTGQDGTALTGQALNGAKVMSVTGSPIAFPANYDLHVFDAPDEIYLVVNYNVDRFQQLSWGKTSIQGVGGSGMWFSGSYLATAGAAQAGLIYMSTSTSYLGTGNGGMGVGLFFEYAQNSNGCSRIHTGLDTTAWRPVSNGVGNLLGSGDCISAMLQALPSNFNQNTVLLPLMASQRRPSNGLSVVLDLVNARLCRNDNHLPGQVVAYGPDQWKIYPMHRKNADQRNGVPVNNGADHSGTFAFAVRYTGA